MQSTVVVVYRQKSQATQIHHLITELNNFATTRTVALFLPLYPYNKLTKWWEENKPAGIIIDHNYYTVT